MKYIGVDKNRKIFSYAAIPYWGMTEWHPSDNIVKHIPKEILPPLEPCCLYRIDKDCYTLIEDKR